MKKTAIRRTLIASLLCLIATACGGSGELAAGQWTSDQLCSFVDDAAVNAASGRTGLKGQTIDWGNDDAGCQWTGPNHSAFNPNNILWMQHSTDEDGNPFQSENLLNLAGADISWKSDAIDGEFPLDARYIVHVGDQRMEIAPGFEYDGDGSVSALALEILTEWVALQASAAG